MAKLYREMSSIFVDRVQVQMRHGTSKESAKSTPLAADKLAPVPTTVPELPEVMTPRPAVVSEMRASVLGFMSSGTVSLSSVKKSKVAAHGQGGVGKTTMVSLYRTSLLLGLYI